VRPIEWGADMSALATSTSGPRHTMGGVIVESGKFDWGNGKFPEIHVAFARLPWRHLPREPSADFQLHMKARMEIMRTFALRFLHSTPGCFAGARVADVRMERHCANAFAVAKFLQGDPRVAWVNYPGLRTTSIFHWQRNNHSEGRVRAA